MARRHLDGLFYPGSGGEQPFNVAAFTAFLFPLSLAYAVVKFDLFEIDAMLREVLTRMSDFELAAPVAAEEEDAQAPAEA